MDGKQFHNDLQILRSTPHNDLFGRFQVKGIYDISAMPLHVFKYY